jgi:hypothetical protein
MKTDNERLKLIIHDVRLIYLSKLQLVQSVHGISNADIVALSTEMQTAINHFDNPTLWMAPIPFDDDKITSAIVAIDTCPPTDLPKFFEAVRTSIDSLKSEVITLPVAEIVNTLTSDFNLKVLDALQQAQRNIGGRKIFFKRNQGVDLEKDPTFIPMQAEQRPVSTEYRRALTNNEVQSTESDVLIFRRIGDAIQQSTLLGKFFSAYQMLTNSMRSKLPVA